MVLSSKSGFLLLAAALLAGGCSNSAPTPASCTDGTKNGTETDVDCGGTCAPCGAGLGCAINSDCMAGVCLDGKCSMLPPTCSDGVKDGNESDVDCGGSCIACVNGKTCGSATDCHSGVCTMGTCQGSCTDGVKNGDETDVDCGGSCAACGDDKACVVNKDCQSLVCTNMACAPATCMDMVKNQDETDVDCGGGKCTPCTVGKACIKGSDCQSGLCFNNVCVDAGCGDHIKNGSETDVDCGGSCPPCAQGKTCAQNADCIDGSCINMQCAAPSCMDMIHNGQETDVDCGGPMCNPCQAGQGCKVAKDCLSQLCVNSQCQMPSCKDGVKNGTETDVDCGGQCPACNTGRACVQNGDCWNNQCANGACGGDGSLSVGGQGNPAFDPNGDGSKLVVLDGGGNVTVDRQTSLLNIARFIFVSNSAEGTVSKVDPNMMKEVARYCTAPGCNADPSRASVSLDGNVGVANRASYFYGGNPKGGQNPASASAVMIAGDISKCVDRNGNGKIDTNLAGGTIAQNSPFYWKANTRISPDECVLWWTPLSNDRNGNFVGGGGTLPRSATFDANPSPDGSVLSSNFYVGLNATRELAQIDAKTGAIKQQIDVQAAPYSSVFDRFGYLWIKDLGGPVMRVDTNNNLALKQFPTPPCSYAISADKRGYIYGAGNTCVARMDPTAANPQWEKLDLPNSCFTRGPSLDANFNLWVPDTCHGGYHVDASKPFGQGMTLKKDLPLTGDTGQYILGTAIDGNGYPWFINTELPGGNCCSNYFGNAVGTAWRVDPANGYALTKVKVGMQPYVYSDLSGSQLALTAPTTGSYRKTFQPACGSKATWTTLTWTDAVPQGTTLQVFYRAAADAFSLQNAPFVPVGQEPPAIMQPVMINLPMGTDPSYFQVQFTLSTSDTQNKPSLGSITVGYSCPQ